MLKVQTGWRISLGPFPPSLISSLTVATLKVSEILLLFTIVRVNNGHDICSRLWRLSTSHIQWRTLSTLTRKRRNTTTLPLSSMTAATHPAQIIGHSLTHSARSPGKSFVTALLSAFRVSSLCVPLDPDFPSLAQSSPQE